MDFHSTNPTASAAVEDAAAAVPKPQTHRLGRGRSRDGEKHVEDPNSDIAASPERRSTMTAAAPQPRWEILEKVVPAMDAVVKVFCFHTEPNFSMPWQRKRQYSSSSSGFVIGGRRVLTNAHSVEHHTQVQLKKRGSDTKYLATVLAIGTECDIGKAFRVFASLS